MSHVLDDLELYVLGALPSEAERAITAHTMRCAGCAAEARALESAVAALQDALPAREPPPGLRGRLLASAGARPKATAVRAVARPATRTWRAWLPTYALVPAVVVLAVLSVGALRQVDSLRAEIDEARGIGLRVSQPAKTWYMSGVDRWQGAGGMLYAPQGPSAAFVVFHDLAPAPAGQRYTIWLVDTEGRWIRGSSFAAGEGRVRLVDVGVPVDGFDRCAVTLENRAEGRREGPIVMQSRFY